MVDASDGHDPVDLEAIKARWKHGYIEEGSDIDAFRAASRDVRQLYEEVERLRSRVGTPSPSEDQPLQVEIVGGTMRISIGVNTLAHAVTYADWANPYDDQKQDYFRTFAIADAPQFAKDVASEMQREAEDGSSPLSNFIDAMTEAAVNDGSLGLHDEDVALKHGETHAVETWADSIPQQEKP